MVQILVFHRLDDQARTRLDTLPLWVKAPVLTGQLEKASCHCTSHHSAMLDEDSDSYESTVESMSDLDPKEKPDLELDYPDGKKAKKLLDLVMDIHYNNPKADLSLVANDRLMPGR